MTTLALRQTIAIPLGRIISGETAIEMQPFRNEGKAVVP